MKQPLQRFGQAVEIEAHINLKSSVTPEMTSDIAQLEIHRLALTGIATACLAR